MLALNRPLDSWNQRHSALPGKVHKRPQVDLPIVQRNRQRRVAERRGPLDQRPRVVREPIDWIFAGMSVQVDFQHR